jgi:hypothetical protein
MYFLFFTLFFSLNSSPNFFSITFENYLFCFDFSKFSIFSSSQRIKDYQLKVETNSKRVNEKIENLEKSKQNK